MPSSPLHVPLTVRHSMSPLLGGKSERAVDDHATQLAHFAVGEIATKANVDGLSLVRVTKLSTQVVAGMKYYFDLETKDKGGATRHYEAQVWEKPVSAPAPPAGAGVATARRGSRRPRAASLHPFKPARTSLLPRPQGGYDNSAPELTGYKETSQVGLKHSRAHRHWHAWCVSQHQSVAARGRLRHSQPPACPLVATPPPPRATVGPIRRRCQGRKQRVDGRGSRVGRGTDQHALQQPHPL